MFLSNQITKEMYERLPGSQADLFYFSNIKRSAQFKRTHIYVEQFGRHQC